MMLHSCYRLLTDSLSDEDEISTEEEQIQKIVAHDQFELVKVYKIHNWRGEAT